MNTNTNTRPAYRVNAGLPTRREGLSHKIAGMVLALAFNAIVSAALIAHALIHSI